ncbi:MAG: hypothetical protein K6G92_04845 [Bacteroidaceae bacterium]|nr:hypothetical protein [Bacteroidaceae bacterium]
MKKRILLSLVAFFAMTAMWASLIDAYKITVAAAANGKTNATAEFTLSMDNKNAIGTWTCTVALPTGVTYVDGSAAVVPARYPEGYNPVISAKVNEDGTVTFTCYGEEGAVMTGTAGAVATFSVAIAADAPVGDCEVTVKVGTQLVEPNGTIRTDTKDRVYNWTIEQGENPGVKGDTNEDGNVDIADVVTNLNAMAEGLTDAKYDVNGDQSVDIADVVSILNLMAGN